MLQASAAGRLTHAPEATLHAVGPRHMRPLLCADAWRDMAGFCMPYVLEQCTAGLTQNILLTGTESAETSKAAKLRLQVRFALCMAACSL
jgi:hypothetical protein